MRKMESSLAAVRAARRRPMQTVLVAGLVMCVVATPARSQEQPRAMESVAEASRNAREQRAKSTKPARLFTNDDVGRQDLTPEGAG